MPPAPMIVIRNSSSNSFGCSCTLIVIPQFVSFSIDVFYFIPCLNSQVAIHQSVCFGNRTAGEPAVQRLTCFCANQGAGSKAEASDAAYETRHQPYGAHGIPVGFSQFCWLDHPVTREHPGSLHPSDPVKGLLLGQLKGGVPSAISDLNCCRDLIHRIYLLCVVCLAVLLRKARRSTR
jgi:hypothetical protein